MAPRIVYDISWVSNGVWPDEDQSTPSKKSLNGSINSSSSSSSSSRTEYVVKPEVQKYCLISAANSYTDFHIDFGGSSVWYHTVKGDKVFYLIEPTEKNLKVYEKWNSSANSSEVFLGDLVDKCYKFEIKAGNTIFLPSGWIHAVYTPQDSLVFGGNFLQSYSIPLQIKIYDLERRVSTPEKYRFPAFETLQWYAAKFFVSKLKSSNLEGQTTKQSLLEDLKHLNDTLKKWIASKQFYEEHDYQIPRKINYSKLIKSFSSELVKAEIILKASGEQQQTPALKLKLKRPASSLSSTPTETSPEVLPKSQKMYIDGSNDPDAANHNSQTSESQNKGAKKEKKHEVIDVKDIEAIEFGLDTELVDDPLASSTFDLAKPIDNGFSNHSTVNGGASAASNEPQQPIRLVMKLPKAPPKEEPLPVEEPAVVKPLKLKLKLPPNPETGASEPQIIQVEKSLITSSVPTGSKSSKHANKTSSHHHHKNEDEDLIKDLKNAYVEGDFVYPSLSDRAHRTGGQQAEDEVTDPNGREKRKRKLKPHAIEYLMPKQFKGDETETAGIHAESANGEQDPSESSSSASVKPKSKKPKNILDAMIEKNLKQQEKPVKEKKTKAKKAEKDKDYVREEDEDDEDIDFKINCKQNLKLSKKLKKSIAKQRKDQADESGSNCDSSTEQGGTKSKSSSSQGGSKSNDKQQKPNQKKAKKGFATTKQRLSKLLKLNRVINI